MIETIKRIEFVQGMVWIKAQFHGLYAIGCRFTHFHPSIMIDIILQDTFIELLLSKGREEIFHFSDDERCAQSSNLGGNTNGCQLMEENIWITAALVWVNSAEPIMP